jgi:carbamoyltransferase
MFLKRIIHEELEKIEGYDKSKVKFLFPEHHLSHAASAFYSSPYNDAAILTIDGVGEWATASISAGKGNSIEILKELRFPHSLGLLYSAFTYFLGFKVNSGEYKLMGLAPYGNPDADETQAYIKTIKEQLISIKDDGSIWLNQDYFSYAIQQVTEEIVYKMAAEAKKLTGSDYLCMAGGVALNCVSNGKLLQSGLFKDIFIQPAAGDAGGALGAAQAAYYIYFSKERIACVEQDEMQGSYLGPEYSDKEIGLELKKLKAISSYRDNFDQLSEQVADLINEGKVVGWFQGRMEFGPRALGNRSILGDARNPEMQKKLNLKIKYREGFRPFAPSVKAEDVSEYFELTTPSPYMLIVAPVKQSHRNKIPGNYYQLPLMERLYTLRSDIPAVTHVDFSARVQTIHQQTNERYWKLLDVFKQKTGYGLMVNTSFNVRGEPPVCTPADAYKCFMRTEMDYLVIGNYILSKTEQPKWEETGDWRKEFNLD